MSIIPAGVSPDFNATLLNNTDLCTLQTCPLVLAHVNYIPSLWGNSLYAAIFGLALIIQVMFTLKYPSTWGYGIAMFGGLVLEVVSYAGRIQMHNNPFTKSPFLMYLVSLTIGPAFLAAAIYLCLSRIVVTYSETVSRLRPASYTLIFMGCDFLSLLLQAAGGGIASGANAPSMDAVVKDIIITGVSWQVASLVFFVVLCEDFARRVRNASACDFPAAALTIFIRCVLRTAELSGGFHGRLANQQVTFMILEEAMIAIAVIYLTIFHPGLVFRERGQVAAWNIRRKDQSEEKTVDDIFVNTPPYSGGQEAPNGTFQP